MKKEGKKGKASKQDFVSKEKKIIRDCKAKDYIWSPVNKGVSEARKPLAHLISIKKPERIFPESPRINMSHI